MSKLNDKFQRWISDHPDLFFLIVIVPTIFILASLISSCAIYDVADNYAADELEAKIYEAKEKAEEAKSNYKKGKARRRERKSLKKKIKSVQRKATKAKKKIIRNLEF